MLNWRETPYRHSQMMQDHKQLLTAAPIWSEIINSAAAAEVFVNTISAKTLGPAAADHKPMRTRKVPKQSVH